MRCSTLGERESGTARLEEAVTAYRAALKEYTRERVPLQWAITQNNLAGVFEALFDRTGKRSLLNDALEHLERAISVFSEAEASHYFSVAGRIKAHILEKLAKRTD